MRLYYHPLSLSARRAVVTALHLGAAVELERVDLFKGAQREPQFLKMNPNHRVPVLDDQGYLLWESYAIMQYLADSVAEQTLYPADLRARMDINRWLFWCAAHFSPGVGLLNFEHTIKGPLGLGAADPDAVSRGELAVREFGGVLDAHLADREWICGSALTLADIAIALTLANRDRAKVPVAGFAHIQRWLPRIESLDAWRRTEPSELSAA